MSDTKDSLFKPVDCTLEVSLSVPLYYQIAKLLETYNRLKDDLDIHEVILGQDEHYLFLKKEVDRAYVKYLAIKDGIPVSWKLGRNYIVNNATGLPSLMVLLKK